MNKEVKRRAERLLGEARSNTAWRRTECINLIPSEQPVSAFVETLMTADSAARYNEHSRLSGLTAGAADVRYYNGTAFIMEKEQELKQALRDFFRCSQAEVRIISGQMANDTVYDALKAFREQTHGAGKGRLISRVLVHSLIRGGHLSAQPMGALKNYLAMDAETGRPAVETFPAREDNPYRIDIEAAKELILRTRPELLVFGRSMIIHSEPIREIAAFIHSEFGSENPERPLIMCDAAHVLGLLGPDFQDPLAEGADIVTGSTHKTFFGPQRGVILSNIAPGSSFEKLWRLIETRTFPGHVSNHHLGTMLGLLGATYEMIRYRNEYPRQVIANAKAFARALAECGLPIEGDAENDYTETHQVLLRVAPGEGKGVADRLEAHNIIVNAQALAGDPGFAAASGIRMGTQEMTRYGMKEADFRDLAALLAAIVNVGEENQELRQQISMFRSRFTTMEYVL